MMSLATEHAVLASCLVVWGCRIFIQSTLLIAAGLTANGLLHRRSAALRSMILRGTLLAVLVCPIMSGVSGLNVIDLPIPRHVGLDTTPVHPMAASPASSETGRSVITVGSRVPKEPARLITASPQARRRPARMSWLTLYFLLSAGWVLGCVTLLGRLGWHHLGVRRLLGSAGPGPERVVDICRETAGRMGFKIPSWQQGEGSSPSSGIFRQGFDL